MLQFGGRVNVVGTYDPLLKSYGAIPVDTLVEAMKTIRGQILPDTQG